jgi:hypothetical protein
VQITRTTLHTPPLGTEGRAHFLVFPQGGDRILAISISADRWQMQQRAPPGRTSCRQLQGDAATLTPPVTSRGSQTQNPKHQQQNA